MKKHIIFSLACFLSLSLYAGTVIKTYHFGKPDIKSNGNFQTISFDHTLLSGKPGEPMLPWQAISLMLPPGESAVKILMQVSGFVELPGNYIIQPQQDISPISKGDNGKFLKNEAAYSSSNAYPLTATGNLTTSYLNGYAFALCTFTPLIYYPYLQKAGYYSDVTITISTETSSSSAEALKNLSPSEKVRNRIRQFSQNTELIEHYPAKKSASNGYQILIITGDNFTSGFAPLVHMYDSLGISAQIYTVENIYSTISGIDNQDKIRNLIKREYQQKGIEYALLGGDVDIVPNRGFYCHVISGSGYTSFDIPADLYYSGMDGNYDANANGIYGEVADSADLLPDVSVGRLPFGTAQEQANIIHKTIWYRTHQKPNEQARPLLAAEFMDSSTPRWTMGQDYLELLVDNHDDNGYFTHGIPSAYNNIDRLFDTLISPGGPVGYTWTISDLFSRINNGPSFIYHAGHANQVYVMRLNLGDVTNANFYALNGVTHNYTLMYTHGCDCGAFDANDCIAEKMVLIENFLAGGIFNSRYGWFDQGTTEGPSAHLNREFVSAIYNDTVSDQIHEIGTAHLMSKIKTAPWVTLPGEFEPGAQRWCHYDCNLLGDPSLWVFTENITVGIQDKQNIVNLTAYPNPCSGKVTLKAGTALGSSVSIRLINTYGQIVKTWEKMSLSEPEPLTLNLPQIPTGVYTIEIEGANLKARTKLIVR
ncbi:MAG: C25 family cysteine peptidase [Bacteroidetes bacterium]|nr:C25 family cysteine peptidase [Bacteroidota bacterium]